MSDHIDLPVNMDEDSHVEEVMTPTTLKLPEQPKDRPFAQLIEMKTTPFPERFQNVLEAEDQTALQRAANLRAVLKSDFKLLAIYFLILLFFFGGALFMACGGLDLLPTRGDFIFGFVYFVS